ncbi:Sec-independent protein translocase protein TatA [Caenorhabditis elegans]|uniref:Sec-independent protein translocase protein TatA n=1 Tax=Caenorhabditis elegans TaxID=6239 RepID=Q95XA1_CAEEL|nr:Sec-independent protein translocase protein TatA [Caenorhabditis elegans]CCD66822.1 Sec-independent protein translocase protein TatA [Caenorhabditis elegans]|eukprot:NP_740917.1 Uncharacterized protein CELE_Y37F4.2 [Caenorhabditis elegans]
MLFIGIHSLLFRENWSKVGGVEYEGNLKIKVEVVGNKAKLSENEIEQIRKIAELMGNPTEPDEVSDEKDDSSESDY